MPPPPDVREAQQALDGESDDDAPGDHGKHEPWVRCAHRVQEVATDPLGPVVSHGYKEAPGWTPKLLGPKQRKFLRKANLRTRDDGGVNSVLYTDLWLPETEPSDAELESLLSGAIRLAGRRPPAPVAIARLHTTPGDDGLGHVLPPMRVWDAQFIEQGAVVTATGCTLVAPVGERGPATLSCRLPAGNTPLRFGDFTTTEEDAGAVALNVTEAAYVVAASKRYDVSGDEGLARWVVFTDDLTHNRRVVLDGGGNILDVAHVARGVTFDGVGLHYEDGHQVQVTPFDVGAGQTAWLDTMPWAEVAP